MQTNLLWNGLEEHSKESCVVSTNETGIEVSSVIVGRHEDLPFHVEYAIRTNTHWETIFFQLHGQYAHKQQDLLFESDGHGNWQSNGKLAEAFEGCVDVDLPLTPFTNSLPIRRLQLGIGNQQEIQVLYFDLLVNEIKVVRQKYTRPSATQYHYENVPNDFEATITVDEQGFVIHYPSLFQRQAGLT